MDIEKAKKKLKLYSNIYDDSVSEMYKVILLELEKKDKEIEQLENKIDNLVEEQNEREKYTHKLEKENKTLKNFTTDLFNEDVTETFIHKDEIKKTVAEVIQLLKGKNFEVKGANSTKIAIIESSFNRLLGEE